MAEKREYVKLTTPKIRCSFVQVFEPKEYENDGKPKFSMEIIWDDKAQKTEEFKKIKRAIGMAMAKAHGKDQKKWPNGWKNPLRPVSNKSESSRGDAYQDGFLFSRASCKPDRPPQVIDQKTRKVLTDTNDFYSGCYARVSIAVGYFGTKGNKGVHFLLNNIMKVEDGEKLGNQSDAFSDFGVDKPSDEELLNQDSEDFQDFEENSNDAGDEYDI